MERTPIAVLGASGYSGVEATRILAQHPRAELRVLGSDRWQGEAAEKRIALPGATGKLRYSAPDRAAELARECAAVLLCTPVDASLQLAPPLLAAGVKVIDLSGAFARGTARGASHVHRSPAAASPGHPGDLLRAPCTRQDGLRRRRRACAYLCRRAVRRVGRERG